MKKIISILTAALICSLSLFASQITVVNLTPSSKRASFGIEQLCSSLEAHGYTVKTSERITRSSECVVVAEYNPQIDKILARYNVKMSADLKQEGFYIRSFGKTSFVLGKDGSGTLYGCREIIDRLESEKKLQIPDEFSDAPEMVLRGSCIGLQKPYYLPGHTVYEYPYTPETFPWFYDKQMWTEYLDMLVSNRMNSVYLWNGHPFASLVKLKDYPFAIEVDEETFKKNQEIFSFITSEADKRGIFVIQMFYNIIVSKPFAEHYGIKTQDRNRPIIDYISDYTRKSVAAFIENYPNVGLLVCLGEAMATVDDDVEWFTKTIIPGVKDGLKALGREDEPPLLLRAHDTDCKRVMDAALPIYSNLYTMHKYTGESLTTYEPRGPWAQIHQDLSSLGSVHISNVHILANLEPWRWGSPLFAQKTVHAMHDVHGANALHLYPQASYWDYPYTADKLADGSRLKQIDRDWIWFKEWGRYAWKVERDRDSEVSYWTEQLARKYDCPDQAATHIMNAYDESGEIAPKLLRRFGITEGNRQTLLLGMRMPQLLTPYKFTIYPGFYESCGPEGEKLIEWVEKEYKGEKHIGELPLDIVEQCVAHGTKAITEIEAAAPYVGGDKEEFERLRNDMHCYYEFANFFRDKVLAAKSVLEYGWTGDVTRLDEAIAPLENSLDHYRRLVQLTDSSYLYANSMQTKQRRIPVSGGDGKNKTWKELLVYYQQERDNFMKNLATIKASGSTADNGIKALKPADVAYTSDGLMFTPAKIVQTATELSAMECSIISPASREATSRSISFKNDKTVNLLIGYFNSDDRGFAQAPKLETDASANDYGQADICIANAVTIQSMPSVNMHVYSFAPGSHKLSLPAGRMVMFGFTEQRPAERDASCGASITAANVDLLFY